VKGEGATLTAGQRAKAAMIGAAVTPMIGALCRTLKWQVEGEEIYDQIVQSGRQPVLALWHGRILPGIYHLRNRGIIVITSRNFDGEWIAQVIGRFGFGTARGSTSRGGVRALVQLRRDLAEGRPVAFTVDGPRGPARVAQPGAVWLAGATGNPILPFHIEAERHWSLASWDRTQIPRPFSQVAVVFGPPLIVPDSSPEQVERLRLDLEASLRDLERRAHQMLGRGAEAAVAGTTRAR
jgi:lysophospholipid acyltransferase (LPLAT)-like uncharacterized protein